MFQWEMPFKVKRGTAVSGLRSSSSAPQALDSNPTPTTHQRGLGKIPTCVVFSFPICEVRMLPGVSQGFREIMYIEPLAVPDTPAAHLRPYASVSLALLEIFLDSKNLYQGFPDGSVVGVKNPPAHAGRHGLDLWSRRIPHAEEQQSPCRNCWVCALGPTFHNKRAPGMRILPATGRVRNLHSLQLEKSLLGDEIQR